MADEVRGSTPRWTRLLRRLLQLYVGLLLYGLSGALQVRSGLGLDPWDVLHQGISRHIGLAIGTVVIIVGAVVLLGWIPLRQRPGLGTVSNVVLIGISMNLSLQWLPHVHAMPWRIADMVTGIVLCGIATGMYIGAHFGPGPRDGLMTGLARRTGRSIRLVRTALEVTVLVCGWLLGGTVGLGTVAFALAIGPLAQIFLRIFDTRPCPVDLRAGTLLATRGWSAGRVSLLGGGCASVSTGVGPRRSTVENWSKTDGESTCELSDRRGNMNACSRCSRKTRCRRHSRGSTKRWTH